MFTAMRLKLFLTAWIASLYTLSALIYNFGPTLRSRPEYLDHVIGKLLGGLALFDASNYMTIASQGYASSLPGLKAFFPLYPGLLHLFAYPFALFLKSPINLLPAAIILNMTALSVGIYLLYRLVKMDYSPRISGITAAMLVTFPLGFFFLAPYTEALFLLLTVSCMYAARQQRWLIAGLLAGLASFTRLPGVLLGLFLFIEWLHFHNWSVKSVLHWRSYWLLLAPLGALAYFGFLFINGNGIQDYQNAYTISWPDRHLTWNIFGPIWELINSLISEGRIRPNDLMGLGAVAFGVVGLYIAWRQRQRPSYLTLIIASLILPLTSGSLDSIGRYYMLVFPLFIAYAEAIEAKPWLTYSWLATSALAGVALMTAFIGGIFVG